MSKQYTCEYCKEAIGRDLKGINIYAQEIDGKLACGKCVSKLRGIYCVSEERELTIIRNYRRLA